MQRSWIFGVLSTLLAFIAGCTTIGTRTTKESETMTGYKSHTDLRGNEISQICTKHLNEADKLKKEFIRAKNDDGLARLRLYNDILVHIDRALSQASLLKEVHPKEEIRKNAESCEQEISSFVTDLSLDREVFLAFSTINKEELEPSAMRMFDRTMRDFRRAGVDKDDETRQKIKDIKAELVKIGQEFGQNIRNERLVIKLDNVDELRGMPSDFVKAHPKGPDGKIEISTDYPDFIPFMQYAVSDKRRRELRFKYLNRAPKNGDVLEAMIKKRDELAKLLGYSSYASYIVEDKMIKEAEQVHSFIDKITKIAKNGADKEYNALLNFKRKTHKNADKIFGYENAYLEEGFKKEKFKFDSLLVRPYFAYESVRDGLLSLTAKLFDIRYSPVPDTEVWDPSVVTYDVYDQQGKLGRIFLDMHPREGKYKHAAQFAVVSGLLDRQYPEGALVCNFPDPALGPALMEHSQVVTMFHEFGHLLHHLFAGKREWIPFSGVATEWDFVEAPSQFLEEWAWSPEVLQTFAFHYETKDPIPTALVKKMRAAEEFGKALAARQQMFYAALSVDYFDKDPKTFEPMELLKSLQAKYSYFPYEEGTHFQNSFGHLEGYSAMYYTYMWSLSLAKDLFEPFKKSDIMNLALAKRYKDMVLTPGGSKDAADLVKDFLGRPFRFDAFEQWILTDPLGHE